MLRRVVKLQPREDSSCFGRGECFVQRCPGMRVQIVQHDPDAFRFEIPFIHQRPHHRREVSFRPPLGDDDLSASGSGFEAAEEVTCALPYVFIIIAHRQPRLAG